jgi:hypothetical protein
VSVIAVGDERLARLPRRIGGGSRQPTFAATDGNDRFC